MVLKKSAFRSVALSGTLSSSAGLLQRSHLDIFFKNSNFANKIYLVKRLQDVTFINTFDGLGCVHIFALGSIGLLA